MDSTENTIPFSLVLEKYNTGNYQNAYDSLKKAKITSEESGIAKQAKVEIANQISLQKIADHDYADAIAFSSSNSNIQAKPDFPINFAKGEIIAGISNLYLNKFEDASKFLSNTYNTEETKHFCFYYILSELFKGKFAALKNIKEFNGTFKNEFETLGLAKTTYLQAIYYLMKDDHPSFSRILKTIKPDNQFQKDNLDSLIVFIGRQKATQTHNPTKPLYKLLTDKQLTSSERNYLKKFKTTSSYFDAKNKTSKDDYSTVELKELCENGKPLSEDAFFHLMNDKDLVEYHKYFVFNQASALEQKEDYQRIGTLINKFNILMQT